MKLSTRLSILAVGAGTAITMTLATSLPAMATNATATLTGAGSPAIASSTTPSWSQTLDGLDHNGITATATVDVNDATGTGAGWNLTLSGAVLTSSGHTLGQPSTAAAASFSACDASSSCTLPTSNSGVGLVSYPFTVGTSAAKFYSATAGTGLGRSTGTNTWAINVPANSYAGTYSGAWVSSIVSAP
jgi:hypothetical protein